MFLFESRLRDTSKVLSDSDSPEKDQAQDPGILFPDNSHSSSFTAFKPPLRGGLQLLPLLTNYF